MSTDKPTKDQWIELLRAHLEAMEPFDAAMEVLELYKHFFRKRHEELQQEKAARAKDAELIQKLVDGWYADDGGRAMLDAIEETKAAGFKPTER